jgi:hypothetical protein
MLLQTGGSGAIGSKFTDCLLTLKSAIDDATNEVPCYALFRQQDKAADYIF